MRKDRQPARQDANDARETWRVVDDFPADIAIGAAELDAVEAFLMPLVNAILRGEPVHLDDPAPAGADSQTPQKSGQKVPKKINAGGRRHAAFNPD